MKEVKHFMRLGACVLVGASLLGCEEGNRAQNATQPRPEWAAGWLDVSAPQGRYYGMYVTQEMDQNLSASGILLLPWDERPDCSVSFKDGDTTITVKDQEFHFTGRPLIVSTGQGTLSVLKEVVPLDEFRSRKSLESWVAGAIADPTR